jgi:hypothetical protein
MIDAWLLGDRSSTNADRYQTLTALEQPVSLSLVFFDLTLANSMCVCVADCWCPHCPTGYEWLANSTIVPAIQKQFE